MQKNTKLSDCILWTRGRDGHGYGAQRMPDGTVKKAHRLTWEAEKGPIPVGLGVLHHCDTPACVNLDHLFLGTQADNMADKSRKGRHNKQKLTGQQVDEIILLRRTTGIAYYKIAELYGVTKTTVHATCSGKINRHIRSVEII